MLLAALDPNDSVGILDRYFPEADFFVEFERFDRHLDKLRRAGIPTDYVSVCTPNYLHDAHVRFALKQGAAAVCEKPLVLNPWNVDALEELQQETGKLIYTILQVRHHPGIRALKERVEAAEGPAKHEVDLTYLTARGRWYYASWKGDPHKSGGIATNIGIHFFDLLTWIFGAVQRNVVHVHTHDRAAGFRELEKARVRWFLSINEALLPEAARAQGQRTYRSIQVDGKEVEFSTGFTDLHTRSYAAILAGDGFGIAEARPAIRLAHDIRTADPVGLQGEYHPLAARRQSPHPFERRHLVPPSTPGAALRLNPSR